jgi:hypothetical protein
VRESWGKWDEALFHGAVKARGIDIDSAAGAILGIGVGSNTRLPRDRGAAPTRASRFMPAARSWSVHVGTRKMVIYARAGRSQRKLWWKPAAILTCKSIVGPWHRGERLIEPSSSWFPPKFPSG